MPRREVPDDKAVSLREHGTFNLAALRVTDALFVEHDFFDPRDLLQVRYEMLRRVEAEGLAVTEVATRFGVSRPTFYTAQRTFAQEGLAGLVPRKRGPRGAHKLTAEVMVFVAAAQAQDAALGPADLVHLVEERFGVRVHRRSVERALARLGEKRP